MHTLFVRFLRDCFVTWKFTGQLIAESKTEAVARLRSINSKIGCISFFIYEDQFFIKPYRFILKSLRSGVFS